MSGRGVAGVVLEAHVNATLAHRHPHSLAAPPRVDELRAQRQDRAHCLARTRRCRLLELCREDVRTGADAKRRHAARTIPALMAGPSLSTHVLDTGTGRPAA